MRLYLFENAIYLPTVDPFPGFLIQTSDNKNILIDTGITPIDADLLNKELGSEDIIVKEEMLPVNCLASLGILPEDIGYVINTHFHYDHCGYNSCFTNAAFFIQHSHYEYAKKHKSRKDFYLSENHWDKPEISYTLLDGDLEILPNIHIVKTDGHSTGIQSVIVDLPNTGSIMIPSDALRDSRMMYDDINPAQYSMFDDDSKLVNQGASKLKKIIQKKNINIVFFNHDGKTWQSFKKSPHYYD